MRRLSFFLFLLAMFAASAYIVTTSVALPERVASHFTASGANGWMTRDTYVVFIAGFATVLPLLVVGSMWLLPRLPVRDTRIATRSAEQSMARREAAKAALADLSPWLGCLLAAFIAGMHHAILEANRLVPPQLPMGLFLTLMGAFLAALAIWIAVLTARVRTAA
jgi:hypothetical protein